MEILGVRARRFYVTAQLLYTGLIFYKLLLTFGNMHFSEISVYGIFLLITPITMKNILTDPSKDMNEFLRLLLYSIVELTYLAESIGIIWVNLLPITFIILSLISFSLILFRVNRLQLN